MKQIITLTWENLKQDKCPKCGKKLHMKLGHLQYALKKGYRDISEESGDNRLIHCYSKKCDFKIMSKKIEEVKKKLRKEHDDLMKKFKININFSKENKEQKEHLKNIMGF